MRCRPTAFVPSLAALALWWGATTEAHAEVDPADLEAAEGEPAEGEPAEGEPAMPPALPEELASDVELLLPGDTEERVAAVQAMADGHGTEDIAQLQRIVEQDPAPEVRAAALQSLHARHADDRRSLFRRVSYADPDQRVRSLARQLEQEARIPPAPGATLTFIGWAMGGISYLPTALAGLIVLAVAGAQDDSDQLGMGWKLLVPVAGPMWGILAHDISGGPGATDIIFGLALMSSLFQAASVGLLIAGLVQWVQGGAPSDADWRRRHERPLIVPAGPEGSAGITVAGWL